MGHKPPNFLYQPFNMFGQYIEGYFLFAPHDPFQELLLFREQREYNFREDLLLLFGVDGQYVLPVDFPIEELYL